jgi:hypothetical protein
VKVGDLVKFRMHPGIWLPEKYYLIIKVFGSGDLISLCGFPSNQVFRKEQLEVAHEGG